MFSSIISTTKKYNTRILWVSMYSGCSWKNLVVMLVATILAACSSVGSKTSYVAKMRWKKYWQEMPAVRSSSKASFFSPVTLLVFRSLTTSERIRGSIVLAILGMGKISLPLKYWAYLTTLFRNLPDFC